jgi:hypothetical protein
MAALLVEKNSQMPPWCTNGGITGRKKSENAAVLLYWRHYWWKIIRKCRPVVLVAALLVEKIH